MNNIGKKPSKFDADDEKHKNNQVYSEKVQKNLKKHKMAVFLKNREGVNWAGRRDDGAGGGRDGGTLLNIYKERKSKMEPERTLPKNLAEFRILLVMETKSKYINCRTKVVYGTDLHI